MTQRKFEVAELYRFCNNKQLFTCVSISQYDKMFELASIGITQRELSYILYLCLNYSLDTICQMIAHLFGET